MVGRRSSPSQSVLLADCPGGWAPAGAPDRGSLWADKSAGCCGDLKTALSEAWTQEERNQALMWPINISYGLLRFFSATFQIWHHLTYTLISKWWKTAVTWWALVAHSGCDYHKEPGSWGRADWPLQEEWPRLGFHPDTTAPNWQERKKKNPTLQEQSLVGFKQQKDKLDSITWHDEIHAFIIS